MGYAHYKVARRGQVIEAGYDVPDVCNRPDCTKTIDRGLAHLCGAFPGGDEYGCGFYFCSSHLYMVLAWADQKDLDLCGQCWTRWRDKDWRRDA